MVGQTEFFSLCWVTILEEGNAEFNPVTHRLKTNFVSHPVREVGLIKTYTYRILHLWTNNEKLVDI